MRLRSLLVLLLFAIPTFVSAQSTPDAEFCAGSAGTVDDRIAACTSAITSGRLSAASLAVAFRNRGNAWSAKGDKDRAIADYNEAIRLNPKSATAYRNRGSVRIPGAPAFGDGGNAKAQHLTPEVSALVKTAQELMNATPPKYAEAIAKLKEADAFPTHSAFKQHVINEMLGFAYVRTNDYSDAAKMLESGLNDGQLDEADVPKRIRALAKLYYQLKNYDKAIEFGTRAIKEGYAGSELNTFVTLVGQSYYLKRDWEGTQNFYDELVNGEIERGETPRKESLRLLLSACVQLKDFLCEYRTLRWQARYYPAERWKVP